MRTVDSFSYEGMLVSVFKMNEKYIVKIEAGPMEQTYKFSTEELENAEAVRTLFNDAFMQQIKAIFNTMYAERNAQLKRIAG